jgi:DNA-damage-inducible protein D
MGEPSSYSAELDRLKRISPDGAEYWMARDLQGPLGYERWERFADVVGRAMDACASANVPVENHFRETAKMVTLGSGSKRATDDWFLSRYACYLIAMSGDGSKPEVAAAKTYFAVQTRRQEQTDAFTATERRRELRERVKDANKGLNSAAKDANVTKFGVFHDAGYKALYGGLGKAEVEARKGIGKDELLECIGHTELAAHYFRITQTQEKLVRDGVSTQYLAIETHKTVGRQVRETMARISGTRPEDLPAETSLKKLKKQKPAGFLDGKA